MKEKRNIHLQVQEMCDCYATADPLKEMSEIKGDSDQDEAAVKWLALAALHGINNNAKAISITRTKGGNVRVSATYRETDLPTPGSEIGKKIMKAVGEITHIKGGKGKSPLALGVRSDRVELKVKMKSKDKLETVTLTFPK